MFALQQVLEKHRVHVVAIDGRVFFAGRLYGRDGLLDAGFGGAAFGGGIAFASALAFWWAAALLDHYRLFWWCWRLLCDLWFFLHRFLRLWRVFWQLLNWLFWHSGLDTF